MFVSLYFDFSEFLINIWELEMYQLHFVETLLFVLHNMKVGASNTFRIHQLVMYNLIKHSTYFPCLFLDSIDVVK